MYISILKSNCFHSIWNDLHIPCKKSRIFSFYLHFIYILSFCFHTACICWNMLHVLKIVSFIPENFHLVPAAADRPGGVYQTRNRTGIKRLTTRKNKKAPSATKRTPKNRRKTKKGSFPWGVIYAVAITNNCGHSPVAYKNHSKWSVSTDHEEILILLKKTP